MAVGKMKWYKHDADASSDAKIKKLLLRHGAVGYAIYFHCLELIAGNISETNITFELEHDAEIIADNLKIRGDANESGIDLVNRVMHYICDLGLFENKDGRITCYKMMKRLDSSMTSSPTMRKLITTAKESHDRVMTESCKTRLEETRLEENKSSPSSTKAQPYESGFVECWTHYPRKGGKTAAYKQYVARRRSGVDRGTLLQATIGYAKLSEKTEKQYIKHGATFYGPNTDFEDYLPKQEDPPKPECRICFASEPDGDDGYCSSCRQAMAEKAANRKKHD